MPRYAPNRHAILALSRKHGPINTAGVVEHTPVRTAPNASGTLSKMVDARLLRECHAARGTYMLTAEGIDLLNQWDARDANKG